MDSRQGALSDVLRKLNEDYIFKVNHAAEHDRWDLVQELTNYYFDDVLKVISASATQ